MSDTIFVLFSDGSEPRFSLFFIERLVLKILDLGVPKHERQIRRSYKEILNRQT